VEFFNCSLSKSTKNPLELAQTWLDSTRSVCTSSYSRVWLDWIGLDSTLLVCTHPYAEFSRQRSRTANVGVVGRSD